MAKRFIDTGRYRQAWRKLDPRFRAAYAWLTENCDAAGFWRVDTDLFKFECGYVLDVEKFLEAMDGAVVRHSDQLIMLTDFVEVNYGSLREGYNPHKPALRALQAAKLGTNSSKVGPSFNQASTKLEEEGEGEEEGEQKGVPGETPAGPPPIPFTTFWDTYAKKIDRPKCEAKWAKLTPEEQAAVIEHATRYVAVTQGDREKYRRHPETYLNNRSWESEDLITSQTNRAPASATDQRRATIGDRNTPIDLGPGRGAYTPETHDHENRP